jgi:hypothetical protein
MEVYQPIKLDDFKDLVIRSTQGRIVTKLSRDGKKLTIYVKGQPSSLSVRVEDKN